MREPATLRPELQLAAETGARLIAGVDEVGRGALAGPVTIGVTVLDVAALSEQVDDNGVWPVLDGVCDSKLLTPAARRRWRPEIQQAVAAWSVHHGSVATIDSAGITTAMAQAGRSAIDDVQEQLGHQLDLIILDGTHNWLSSGLPEGDVQSPIHTMRKADTVSLTTAAASVLAKCTRDALMAELAVDEPSYDWASNKGYGSPAHRAGLESTGISSQHRRSWNLGVTALPGL